MRILLVDDELDIVSVLKKGLQLKGFEVDGFIDPLKALEKSNPDYYDIVLSDIRMPGMNGFQFCRKILEKDPKVKIFFLSAFDIYEKEAETVFPTLKPKFIKKPISYEDLTAVLVPGN